MKKKLKLSFHTYESFKRIFRIMRTVVILFFICTSGVLANTYAQSTKLSINVKDAPLQDVIQLIEDQSEFYFLYKDEMLDVSQKVDINVKNVSIEDILNRILPGDKVKYEIRDRQILILTNESENTKTDLPQEKTITGKVINSAGEPIPGATVIVKGTTQGTITNPDGNFTLKDVKNDAILVFSFVGMKSQEIAIGEKDQFVVVLEKETIGLDEVVAIGYGVQKKTSLTGSISQVKIERLKENPLGNVTQALQGTAPGVEVYVNNQPGSNAKIRIHGLGTINNNDPLWVIDGVPGGNLNQLNPTSIESITILKDAASTAIYGARGANGVILVSTKEGKKDQPPKVEIDIRFGTARNTERLDLLGVEEYGEMLWLQSKNSGVTPNHAIYGSGVNPSIPRYLLPGGANEADLSLYDVWSYPITEANPEGTDWYDEVFQSGITKETNITVTGGTKNSTYAFNVGVLDEDGIVKMTGFTRYTLGTSIKTSINNWLELGQNIGLSYLNDWGLQQDGENGAVGAVMQIPAIMPVYDVMGNYSPISRLTSFDPLVNPIGELERGQDYTRKDLGVRGNVYANISIIKNLTFKSLLGYIIEKDRDKSPLEKNPDSYQARSDHQLTEGLGEFLQYNFTNTLNYSATLADIHKFEVLLGSEAISREGSSFSARREGFLLTDEDYWILDAGEGAQTNGGTGYEWATLSYFGRLHYELNNKYLLDATFRRDGSSRFGKNYRYGNFASLAGAWRISEEKFMDSTKGWLDFLKIRASWGQSGNDNIGNYNGFTTFSANTDYSYYPIDGSNNSATTGFQSAAFGNPDAKWETTTSKAVGFDATLFNHLGLTVDVWRRDTKDMLFKKGIPGVVGSATAPSVNVGDMKNIGFDVQLNYHGSALNKELKYNISLNVSHYKNEIVKLSDKQDEVLQGFSYRSHIYQRSEVGTSYPEFFGYDVIGIFQTQEEADSYAPEFGGSYNAPGHFKFRDVNDDGVIDDDDRTYIGSPHPDFTSSLTADIQYKQFDLSAVFIASVGNDIANVANQSLDFNFFLRQRSKKRLYESWGSPYLENNEDAKMPIAELNDTNSQLPSTYFIEDGSYLRLQSLQLGYNLPKRLMDKSPISSLRVYMMATNLFTITGYSGLDPQLQTSDGAFGADFGVWPTPKRYTIGFNISF